MRDGRGAARAGARGRRIPGWERAAPGSFTSGSAGEGARVTALRCTAKLLRRLRWERLPEPGPATAALGDWYANLFTLQRQPLVICVSERSLLTVVFPARGLSEISVHFLRGLRDRLQRLRVPPEVIERELAHYVPLAFGKTANRSTIGSMNEFVFQLKAKVDYDPDWQWTPSLLEDDLATVPCAPLGDVYPRDTALALLGGGSRVLRGPWGAGGRAAGSDPWVN